LRPRIHKSLQCHITKRGYSNHSTDLQRHCQWTAKLHADTDYLRLIHTSSIKAYLGRSTSKAYFYVSLYATESFLHDAEQFGFMGLDDAWKLSTAEPIWQR
jgi:hypothetical protein